MINRRNGDCTLTGINSTSLVLLKLGGKIHTRGMLKSMVITYLGRIEWGKARGGVALYQKCHNLFSEPVTTWNKMILSAYR